MKKAIDKKVEEIRDKCKLVRKYTMEMTLEVDGGVHFGPAYSIIEILGALYFGTMNIDPKNPTWEDRDRFILSKGHGVASVYPTLALSGYFPLEELKHYGDKDGHLSMHPSLCHEIGVEASTGSLGQGISFGAGMALAGKIDNKDYRTFVLLGNGECNEGQVWECAMSAAQFGLDNLVAIIDNNVMQCDGESRKIIDMGDFAAKWKAFGWETEVVDGHDIYQLLVALSDHRRPHGKPLAVICNTVKGKGISFFEDSNDYHHVHFVSKELCEKALKDMEAV